MGSEATETPPSPAGDQAAQEEEEAPPPTEPVDAAEPATDSAPAMPLERPDREAAADTPPGSEEPTQAGPPENAPDQAEARELQENDAGRFGDLRGTTGDGLTAHHIPQDALGFAPRADGGAIVMTQADHELTRTYGGKGARTAAEDAGQPFEDVVNRDIEDLRNIGEQQHGDRGYYDRGIDGLVSYYRSVGRL